MHDLVHRTLEPLLELARHKHRTGVFDGPNENDPPAFVALGNPYTARVPPAKHSEVANVLLTALV